MHWRKPLIKRPWALEWALRFWGGKKILADYFLSRTLSMGVPFADSVSIFSRMRSMQDWVPLWYRLGIRRESLAQKAEQEGMIETATGLWMMAKGAFHTAQFPVYQEIELKLKIYRRCVLSYMKAAPHLKPPAQRVEIPFRSIQLPGYLRLPGHGSRESCVVVFGGIDGVKEEMHYYGEYFASRGFSVLYFDPPGIGESWEKMKMEPDFPTLGQAIVHYLRTEMHFTKIGLLGLSLGGNMAIHIAASGVPIQSCVVITPPFHPRPYFKDLFFLVQKAAYHIIGGHGPLEEFMERISLTNVVEKVRCPLLVFGGGRDTILPAKEAIELYEKAREPKKFFFYPEATHGCPERTVEMFYEIERWFRKTL